MTDDNGDEWKQLNVMQNFVKCSAIYAAVP